MNDLSIETSEGKLNIRVGALIVRDGKLLMIWEPNGKHWYTVGGRVKMGEDTYEAVSRELKEELGGAAECLPAGKLAVVNECFFDFDGVFCHEIGFYYLFDGSDLPEELTLSDCEGRLEWLSREDIGRETLFPLFLKDGIPSGERILHVVTRE